MEIGRKGKIERWGLMKRKEPEEDCNRGKKCYQNHNLKTLQSCFLL